MDRAKTIAAVAALSLAAGWGCISSPVLAPSDGQIILSANPTSITLDEFATPPVTSGSTLITAQFLNATGVPQADVSVTFTTDGGMLASNPAGQAAVLLETDENGFVSDTLTLQIGDPDSATVTVRSGGLMRTIDIDKTEIGPNQAPFAFIDISPGGSALLNETVIYDGINSSDPDGDLITCYQWQIETSENIAAPQLPCNPPNSRCEISQGPTNSIVTRSYSLEQMVVVTLRVTDDPNLTCATTGPAEPASAFGGIAVDSHNVVCDRSIPTANAGANQTVTLGANPTVSVPLSGIGSGDAESGITAWDWDCGNGTGTLSGVAVTCDYSSPGTYIVVLTVTNGCMMMGTDTTIITVNP